MKTSSKKYTHLQLSERINIELGLNKKCSLREIARNINRSVNTVKREIDNRKIPTSGNYFNGLSKACVIIKKSPFVCNGCQNVKKCRCDKFFYYANDAQLDYKTLLRECREGIDFSREDFKEICEVIKAGILKGHSFTMIKFNNPEIITVSQRALYLYQEKGYLPTKNIDLPRKVRYKKRNKKRSISIKKDRKTLKNRTYEDFIAFIKDKNSAHYVQMDTVEGIKGHSVLLTFNIVKCGLLLAFKIDNKTKECVTQAINELRNQLGYELFHTIFPVILTDNGSEFFDAEAIENNGEHVLKTKLFYCHPYRSDEKGGLEVMHELIRRFIEKGQNFDDIYHDTIFEIVDNINNIPRKKYDGLSSYLMFINMFGEQVASKLRLHYISGNDIVMKKELLNTLI